MCGWSELGRAAFAVCLTAVGLAGQIERFDRQYAQAERWRTTEPGTRDADVVRGAYRDALRAFLQLPNDAPGYRERLPAGAWSAYQAGDLRQACELFAAAMDAGHRDAFCAEWRLRALLEAGRHVELIEIGRQLAEPFPAACRRVLVAGDGLYRVGALARADGWLRRGRREAGLWVFRYLARERPDDAVAQANLGLALRNVGAEREALAAYRRALALRPDDATIWNDLGLLHKGRGDLAAAIDAFRRSFELDPEQPAGPATTNLARLATRLRQPLLADPDAALGGLLAVRPDAGMARRALLDRLTGRTPGRAPPPASAGVFGKRSDRSRAGR